MNELELMSVVFNKRKVINFATIFESYNRKIYILLLIFHNYIEQIWLSKSTFIVLKNTFIGALTIVLVITFK